MKHGKTAQVHSTEKLCQDMSSVVIDMVMEELADNLTRSKDGNFTADDVEELGLDLKYARSGEHIDRMRRMAGRWLDNANREVTGQTRAQLLERLFISRLSHMFPPAESLNNSTAVSRRVIKGLFAAMEQELGAVQLYRSRGAAQKVYDQVRNSMRRRFDWDAFENHRSARYLVDELLLRFAYTFKEFDDQLVRIVRVINENLDVPEPYAFEGPRSATWTLNERTLIEIFRALFGEFTINLEDPATQDKLRNRYGEDIIKVLLKFLSSLEQNRDKTCFAQRSQRMPGRKGRAGARYWPRY